MLAFTYKAKTKDSRIKNGQLTADSRAEAKALLNKRGWIILSLRPLNKSKLFEGEAPIFGETVFKDAYGKVQISIGSEMPNAKDVIVLTKQLATMIGSGIPLIQAVNILQKQQKSRGLRRALIDIKETVENGATFSFALTKYPKIFDPLYVAMVEAGETSGSLDIILKKLVTYIEKAEKIKSQIKSALAYPVIVFFVAIAVVTGLLIFVVPVFAQQYADTNRQLPWLTQQVINISNAFIDNWLLLLLGLIAFLTSFSLWIGSSTGRKQFDRIILRVPIIGDVLRKIAVGRFCSTMASMLSSGVNLLQALSICAASSGNKTIELFVLNIRKELEKGQNFSTPLREGDLFPEMVVSMVSVGEATGALDDMLTKVSDFYEEEVDTAVKTMLSMIEPIMIIFIGGIVAFIVIAMYLPIFDLAGGIE